MLAIYGGSSERWITMRSGRAGGWDGPARYRSGWRPGLRDDDRRLRPP